MFQLLLLTGARRTEVAEMTRDEVNFKNRIWTIPGERTKTKEVHQVYLCDAAIAILKALPRVLGSRYFFSTTGKPSSGFSKAKKRLDKLALLPAGTDISGVLNGTVLRHIDDRQHSLEQNSARFLRQRIEGGFDERLQQLTSIRPPQAPAALHELLFRLIAAALQNRCKSRQSHSQRLTKLGVYSINPEHDLLLDDATYC
jgi:hypothetical protein